MKDRQPTKTGRVLIAPEDGSTPFYATMTRADEPTDEGTPLSKANLLKDTTAAAVGLTSDAVPDDVLAALAKNKVNKSGDTMTGDLTLTKATYPKISLKQTTVGSVARWQNNGHTAMMQISQDGTDKNRRALIVADKTYTGDVKAAIKLADVIDGTYKDYTLLHTDNFQDTSWQLIYSASPSVAMPAMSSSSHDQYGAFLKQSDIEDIICANNYSEINVIVTLASTKIYDSSSNSKGASADLAVGGRYGDVYGSCEDGGSFTLSGTLERILYRDYIDNDGSRKFRALDDTEYIFKAGAGSQNQMAGLKTTRCEAVTAKATVKVYAR